MTCPNCHEADLELYDYEDAHNGDEIEQKQLLWCPNCQYHCQYKVWYKMVAMQLVWEEKE